MPDRQDVEHAMEAAYTVRQLKDLLDRCDDDARVFFTCDYGDYHHTDQALPVGEFTDVDSGDLAPSAYSQSRVKLADDDPDCEREKPEEVFPVVILRS